MGYTLKGAAELLGITKNTVKYRVRGFTEAEIVRLPDGRIELTQAGFDRLKATTTEPIEEPAETSQEPVKPILNQQEPIEEPVQPIHEPARTSAETSIAAALQQTIELLQGQLAVKDKQISDLTAALLSAQQTAAQAQALHAHQLQLLAEGTEPAQPAEPAAEPIEPAPAQSSEPAPAPAEPAAEPAPAPAKKKVKRGLPWLRLLRK